MVVILLGPPGVGKGTQANKLRHYLDVPHLSTGEALREAKQQHNELGRIAARYIDEGRLVPDELVTQIVAQRLRQPDCRRGCLLDGYPRTVGQARHLDRLLDGDGLQLDVVLALEADPQELVRRILRRGELEDRPDDTRETVQKRLDVYHELTEPLLDYYGGRDLIERIDGMGTREEVFQRICQAVDKHRP